VSDTWDEFRTAMKRALPGISLCGSPVFEHRPLAGRHTGHLSVGISEFATVQCLQFLAARLISLFWPSRSTTSCCRLDEQAGQERRHGQGDMAAYFGSMRRDGSRCSPIIYATQLADVERSARPGTLVAIL